MHARPGAALAATNDAGHRRRILRGLVVLGLTATLAGCGDAEGDGDAASGDQASGGSSPGALKLGYFTPVSGNWAAYTEKTLPAGRLAAADINAAGGVLGKDVELVIGDYESSPEAALPTFSRITELDGAEAIGGTESDGMLAVLAELERTQMPATCPYCGSDALTDKGGQWVWRLSAADAQFGAATAQYARDNGIKTVSILALKSEGSLSAVNAFKKVFVDSVGGSICAEVEFDAARSSYQSEVSEAFGCDPDAVFVSAGTEAGIPILREWARRGYGGRFLMSQDMIVPDIIAATPKLEGAAVGVVGAMDRSSPAFENFAEKYEAEVGEAPSDGYYQSAYYDEWIIHALAITAADSTDGQATAEMFPKVTNAPGTKCYRYDECVKLLKAGEDINYHGASGDLDFNDKGDQASPNFSLVEAKGGEWTPVSEFALDPTLVGG
jgi:branched-chain amino acid transport system substrate-binding protein